MIKEDQEVSSDLGEYQVDEEIVHLEVCHVKFISNVSLTDGHSVSIPHVGREGNCHLLMQDTRNHVYRFNHLSTFSVVMRLPMVHLMRL